MRPWTLSVAAVALIVPAPAAEPASFLSRHLGFSAAEIRQLESGEAVAKSLPSRSGNEVATAGAIRLNVSLRHFLRSFRNMPSFKKSVEVLEVQFVDDLPLEAQRELERKSAGYAGVRNTAALASENGFLLEYAPALWRRLQGEDCPALDGFSYRSVERIVKRPVETATRVLIDENPRARTAFIATQQIYASHYFDGSLGLTAVFETGDATYLIYVNRTRAHALGGAFSSLRKSIATRVIVSTMERKLAETRDRLAATTSAAR